MGCRAIEVTIDSVRAFLNRNKIVNVIIIIIVIIVIIIIIVIIVIIVIIIIISIIIIIIILIQLYFFTITYVTDPSLTHGGVFRRTGDVC